MTSRLAELSERLDEAQRNRAPITQLSDEGALSVEDAYEVQRLLVERRLARGEQAVGVKAGFTSRAKMVQMGVSDLIWGRLTDAMAVEDGGTVNYGRFCHPRIEPEVAFLLGEELRWPTTIAQAAAAVDAVAPALELIDSRYSEFRFSLPDVIADNTSASAFVIGPPTRTADIDNLGVVLAVDGAPAEFGSTTAILGHPLRSLVALARLAGVIPAGSIVLAGAATAAVPLPKSGVVSVSVQDLGRATVHVTEGENLS